MKKTILTSSIAMAIALFSFLIFSFVNKDKSVTNNIETASIRTSTKVKDSVKNTFPDFFYDISTRFNPIKKTDIINAKSIYNILNKVEINNIDSVKSVNFIIVENDKRTYKSGIGNSSSLTDEQINFLKSLDYSTNFIMEVDYLFKGDLIEKTSTPHYTVVPDTQAQYIYGKKALINFLKENTKAETTNISAEKLKAAKLYFTVTKIGTIENVYLDRSSGYPDIDNLIIYLISKTPIGWIPATNSEGENIRQELVISFGLIGC